MIDSLLQVLNIHLYTSICHLREGLIVARDLSMLATFMDLTSILTSRTWSKAAIASNPYIKITLRVFFFKRLSLCLAALVARSKNVEGSIAEAGAPLE